MENEDDLFRPPAPRPYQPGNARLWLPTKALKATLKTLQSVGRRECGIFWYGPKESDGSGRVEYVAVPKQRMSCGNFHVSTDALNEIVHQLSENWKPVAQVHSHPRAGVEHSNYDDRMMSSRKALSLVFPSYGRPRATFPQDVGVHEFQIDYWHLLDQDNAARRVVLCDGDVKVDDFR
jgi:Prokaryotic homologs of the JAB domain